MGVGLRGAKISAAADFLLLLPFELLDSRRLLLLKRLGAVKTCADTQFSQWVSKKRFASLLRSNGLLLCEMTDCEFDVYSIFEHFDSLVTLRKSKPETKDKKVDDNVVREM